MAGTLILCGTPIGNLGDAPPRLAQALAAADIIYCEDTRRSRVLVDSLGVDTPLRSYFVGNEAERAPELARRLTEGETVALVTDAGMPAVSDPGHSAVTIALGVGAVVTVVPGPSAALAALAVSGLPADRFVFEGFLPRKSGERRQRLEALSAEQRTMVVFASPHRLGAELVEMRDIFGGSRRSAVARELTKLHEEVWRGTLAAAVEAWSDRTVKGEVTVVIEGTTQVPVSFEIALAEVEQMVGSGTSLSEAVATVAAATGIRKRRLYQAALALRED